jgi:hypothetical protein
VQQLPDDELSRARTQFVGLQVEGSAISLGPQRV